MRKICMIVEDYPPGGGGGGIFVKELSMRLCKKYEITVITRGEKQSEKIEEGGIRVVRFKGNRIEFLINVVYYLVTQPSFNIYHAHGIFAGLIAKKVKLFKKRPSILHLHGFRDNELIGIVKYHLQKEITKLKYDKVICVDEESAKKIEKLGVKRKEMAIIPPGIDIKKFRPTKRKKKKNIFLFVGRLEKVKNLELLLEAVKRLRDKTRKFELWIVGGGTLEDKLKHYCKNNKLDNIKFLGYIDNKNINKIYSEVNFFVLPSLSEGNPIALLEAMSSGLPFIVSDIPQLSKIAMLSDAGIIFKKNDAEDLTNAMEKMIKMKNCNLKKMEKNSRRYVKNNFQWSDIIQRVEDIYNKLN